MMKGAAGIIVIGIKPISKALNTYFVFWAFRYYQNKRELFVTSLYRIVYFLNRIVYFLYRIVYFLYRIVYQFLQVIVQNCIQYIVAVDNTP